MLCSRPRPGLDFVWGSTGNIDFGPGVSFVCMEAFVITAWVVNPTVLQTLVAEDELLGYRSIHIALAGGQCHRVREVPRRQHHHGRESSRKRGFGCGLRIALLTFWGLCNPTITEQVNLFRARVLSPFFDQEPTPFFV